MIHSMTGFGRGESEVEGQTFLVEVRSVNHRHLDVQTRLPRSFARLEPELRRRVQARLARGKLDVTISQPAAAMVGELSIDREAAARYVEAARELGRAHGLDDALPAARLLALPGVARQAEREIEDDALVPALAQGLDAALDGLLAMREAEGGALERELRQRLGATTALLDAITARAGDVQQAARERLRKKAAQLAQETGGLDEARLHQEVVWAAERLDVTEELVRSRSHVDQFEQTLDSAAPGTPHGRRLEFLLQEMVREANTIGSKASDAPVAHQVVDLKAELERLREQVLNVE